MTTGRSLFSLFPSAFATVPHDLIHVAVDLLSLTEPDKRLSHTSGSSVGPSVRLRPTTRVQVFAAPGLRPLHPSQCLFEAFPGVCPALALAVEPFEQDSSRATDLEVTPAQVVRYGVIVQMPQHSNPCLPEPLLGYAIHSGRLIGFQSVVAGSHVIHIIDGVIQARQYQARFLACLFPYPCQIRSHHFSTRCIVSVFLLSRLTHRGDLRSAGISRLFATPLRLTGPHHSRRGPLLPSFYIGQDTRVLPLRLIPQELLVRRLPGYLPAVVQLDAVFDPGVSALCSSLSHSPHGLRLFREVRLVPTIQSSRGYVSDSGLHPSPRCSRLSSFPACALSHYATGRLTNLTQEGLCA